MRYFTNNSRTTLYEADEFSSTTYYTAFRHTLPRGEKTSVTIEGLKTSYNYKEIDEVEACKWLINNVFIPTKKSLKQKLIDIF